MIAYLKGNIVKKTEKGIILDTGNIGYFVFLPKNILAEIAENSPQEFFIHSHIREDAFDLYGFSSYQQLEFFKKLISINGIGPKVALEILSVDFEKIAAAIVNEDIAFICQIPGIGKKIAGRIVLEMKDKIDTDTLIEGDRSSQNLGLPKDEIIDALIKFGYQRNEIIKRLRVIPEDLKDAEEIITFFLKNA